MCSVRQLIIDNSEGGVMPSSSEHRIYDYDIVKEIVTGMNVSVFDFGKSFDSMINEGLISYYKPTTNDQYLKSKRTYYYFNTEKNDG